MIKYGFSAKWVGLLFFTITDNDEKPPMGLDYVEVSKEALFPKKNDN